MIIEAVAGNVFFLTDAVEANIKGFVIEHVLVLTESLEKNLKPQQLQDNLLMSQVVLVERNVNLGVAQTLAFGQATEPKAIIVAVEHILVMAQDVFYGPLFPLVQQSLVITESVVVDYCKAAFDVFTMVDEALCSIHASPQVEHAFEMRSSATAYLPKKCWINGPYAVEGP